MSTDTTCRVLGEVHFTKEMYERVAEKLKEEIDDKQYYASKSLDVDNVDGMGTLVRLTLNAIIYRNKVVYYYSGPEGGEITDVLPIWWECFTYQLNDEGDFVDATNDFQFSEVRELLKEV